MADCEKEMKLLVYLTIKVLFHRTGGGNIESVRSHLPSYPPITNRLKCHSTRSGTRTSGSEYVEIKLRQSGVYWKYDLKRTINELNNQLVLELGSSIRVRQRSLHEQIDKSSVSINPYGTNYRIE